MNLTDDQILRLLSTGTDPAAAEYDPRLTENLLESTPAAQFTPEELRRILGGAGIATAAAVGVATWKKWTLGLGSAGLAAAILTLALHKPAPPEGMISYEVATPQPVFISSPLPILQEPNVEPIPPTQHSFFAPPGVSNLALTAHITSSLPAAQSPDLKKLQDSQVGSRPEIDLVQLGRGPQSVTFDLGSTKELHTTVLWHRFDTVVTFRDILVEISPDPSFATSEIVFNADHDNTLSKGLGTDHGYVESHFGRIIPLKGKKARHVRVWSNGSQLSEENFYSEVQIWGK